MNPANDTAAWGNFFVAEVGAAAALVGLLFVAISINLAKIIAVPSLPGRAFEALALLVMVLFGATLMLVPGQSHTLLGGEVFAVGFGAWVTTLVIQRGAPKDPSAPRSWMIWRVVQCQIATLPFLIAGASLAAECGGGLYWFVIGVLGSFLAALVNAWVLLVEIQR